jgi:hypothetical protein
VLVNARASLLSTPRTSCRTTTTAVWESRAAALDHCGALAHLCYQLTERSPPLPSESQALSSLGRVDPSHISDIGRIWGMEVRVRWAPPRSNGSPVQKRSRVRERTRKGDDQTPILSQQGPEAQELQLLLLTLPAGLCGTCPSVQNFLLKPDRSGDASVLPVGGRTLYPRCMRCTHDVFVRLHPAIVESSSSRAKLPFSLKMRYPQ